MVVFVPADDFFSSVLSELRELRQTGALCDVTLTIGEARLPAHRCVLTASSHYFHTLFLGQFKEANVLNIDVSLADVTDDFKALELVVEFLYTGKIEIEDEGTMNFDTSPGGCRTVSPSSRTPLNASPIYSSARGLRQPDISIRVSSSLP